MLKEAKRIANIEFKDRVEKAKNLGTLEYEEYIVPASAIKTAYINAILDAYDFDEDKFKEMIRTFELRNKEEDFPVENEY
jgi:hypothetical protein